MFKKKKKRRIFGAAERMSAFQKLLCPKFFIQKLSLKLLKCLSHCMMNYRYNMAHLYVYELYISWDLGFIRREY
jgi:hypothetical protein